MSTHRSLRVLSWLRLPQPLNQASRNGSIAILCTSQKHLISTGLLTREEPAMSASIFKITNVFAPRKHAGSPYLCPAQ
jgi:hypothetical protein